MTSAHDPLPGTGEGASFFVSNLETIERAIAFVCRRAGLRYGDAEDFDSYVKLRLIENDYAIVRSFEGRCSFAGYISVVVQRMLLDYRVHMWGKWHASSEAKRLGPAAVMLESLLLRDGLSLDEALCSMQRSELSMTREEAARIAAKLPSRAPRRRVVDLESAREEDLAAPAVEPTGPSPFESDRTALARRIASVIRGAIEELPDTDRLLFRLRFEAGMRVADIARMLQVEQKPLYRRIETLVSAFRTHLEAAGVQPEDAAALIGDPASDLDFGFQSGNDDPRPSNDPGTGRQNEEVR